MLSDHLDKVSICISSFCRVVQGGEGKGIGDGLGGGGGM